MSTLLASLTWFGIGITIGLGIVTVVIVAIKLAELFEKLFPNKKHPQQEVLEQQLRCMGGNYIVLSPELKKISESFGKRITQLRSDLWASDFVIPPMQIAVAIFPPGKNCVINIEGKEIFNGEIDCSLADEKRADFLIKEIQIYFAGKLINKAGGEENVD